MEDDHTVKTENGTIFEFPPIVLRDGSCWVCSYQQFWNFQCKYPLLNIREYLVRFSYAFIQEVEIRPRSENSLLCLLDCIFKEDTEKLHFSIYPKPKPED